MNSRVNRLLALSARLGFDIAPLAEARQRYWNAYWHGSLTEVTAAVHELERIANRQIYAVRDDEAISRLRVACMLYDAAEQLKAGNKLKYYEMLWTVSRSLEGLKNPWHRQLVSVALKPLARARSRQEAEYYEADCNYGQAIEAYRRRLRPGLTQRESGLICLRIAECSGHHYWETRVIDHRWLRDAAFACALDYLQGEPEIALVEHLRENIAVADAKLAETDAVLASL